MILKRVAASHDFFRHVALSKLLENHVLVYSEFLLSPITHLIAGRLFEIHIPLTFRSRLSFLLHSFKVQFSCYFKMIMYLVIIQFLSIKANALVILKSKQYFSFSYQNLKVRSSGVVTPIELVSMTQSIKTHSTKLPCGAVY